MPPYLEHIIRETGHRHCMILEEVHPETIDYLRPLLRRTIDTGETVQLPHTAWFLHAQTLDGRTIADWRKRISREPTVCNRRPDSP